MIEFKGALSQEVREKQIAKETKSLRLTWLISTVILLFVYIIVVVFKAFISGGFKISDLFSGDVSIFLLIATLVFLIMTIFQFVTKRHRPELDEGKVYSVSFDNDKIVYTPENGFGKREFNYSNLKKIVDEGDYYLIVSKENNIRIVCEKSLLVQGSLSEFDTYFDNIIERKNSIEASYQKEENKESSNLNKQNDNIVVEIVPEGEESTLGESEVSETQKNNAQDEKTFEKSKFKKTKTRNEKSFKFAWLGIIAGLLSVALTPLVVRFGISFAVSAIENIFNNLFHGFVIEAITFLLAIMIIFISAVLLFGGCILLTPVIALLSLIFPIYQLAAVNRRWFSWVSLVIGILCIGGCLLAVALTMQGL